MTHLELNSFFWRSEFIISSRAQRADHARIARQLRFRFGRKSFYRFGIRSCLATSHKQILKTQLNMTWSCILVFQATRPATWAHFIHPLFIVHTSENRKVFLRQKTAGCQHNSARLDKWPEIFAVGVLTPKERWPELQLACESIRFFSLFAAGDVSRNVPSGEEQGETDAFAG